MGADRYHVLPGDPESLGAKQLAVGINFAFAVPEDSEAALVIVSTDGDMKEIQRIPLDKEARTGCVSSVCLKDARAEEIGYYYEVDGKRVMDPYASGIRGNACTVLPGTYDWGEDAFPRIPLEELLIYKLHVRGFTKKARKVKKRGTFAGVIEQIPYIEQLGFNAVELMPIYEWDESLKIQPFSAALDDGKGTAKAAPMKNYWGYAEKNFFFAPKARFSSDPDAPSELRSLVRALHGRGMEVIMEMYFPSGTDPFMAMLAIRHWKSQYRIDGFHFIGDGVPVSSIVKDPLLTTTKLCFENVDADWIYGGNEPRLRNLLVYRDEFEHTARALLKGDEGQLEDFARFVRRNPSTHGYVNYVANVNGFTLYDAVCYDRKHNEKNGEDNRDGTHWNLSWNCGVEGPSKKRQIRKLRIKQVKNALLYTFLAQGTPLLLAGDEGLNTQGGNNNAYASDDSTGWTDWSEGKDAEEIRKFTAALTAFRRKHPILHMPRELKGTDYRSLGCPDISFHDSKAWVCSFENVSRTLAVMYNGLYTQEGKKLPGDGKGKSDGNEAGAFPPSEYVYIAYNAFWDAHPFALPDLPANWKWYPAISSGAEAGAEFAPEDAPPCENQKYCESGPRTVTVLIGKRDETIREETPAWKTRRNHRKSGKAKNPEENPGEGRKSGKAKDPQESPEKGRKAGKAEDPQESPEKGKKSRAAKDGSEESGKASAAKDSSGES